MTNVCEHGIINYVIASPKIRGFCHILELKNNYVSFMNVIKTSTLECNSLVT